MPKRRTNPCLPASASSVSLVSFDAALDILASDTFTRLEALCAKFEAAATIQLNEGVLKHRWEEAVKRYWMMKSMEQCCMAMANGTSSRKANVTPVDGGVKMEDGGEADNDPGGAYCLNPHLSSS